VSEPLLVALDLHVARGRSPVLRGVDLAVREGEAVALVGPNAAGKSTLVCALAGLLPATRGRVLFRGRPLHAASRMALAREVALVAPEEGGPDALTVEERVALGRYPHRGPFLPFTSEDRDSVERALARTGISGLADRRLGSLSAGERQLAALARGLAQEPRVLLLDEPAAHLDIGHQLSLFRVLDQVRSEGVAVLAVIHELQRAASWAGRMVLLDAGRVVAEGPPEDVLLSAACASAFGVAVRAHREASFEGCLYSFQESSATPPVPSSEGTGGS
jgi:iron complex transport system ATP-binding protein